MSVCLLSWMCLKGVGVGWTAAAFGSSYRPLHATTQWNTQNPHCPTMHFNYRYFETEVRVVLLISFKGRGGTNVMKAHVAYHALILIPPLPSQRTRHNRAASGGSAAAWTSPRPT